MRLRLRQVIFRPLAVWLQKWAASILADLPDEESVQPAPFNPSTLAEAPEHWRQRVLPEPPAHWLARVREGAPELLHPGDPETIHPSAAFYPKPDQGQTPPAAQGVKRLEDGAQFTSGDAKKDVRERLCAVSRTPQHTEILAQPPPKPRKLRTAIAPVDIKRSAAAHFVRQQSSQPLESFPPLRLLPCDRPSPSHQTDSFSEPKSHQRSKRSAYGGSQATRSPTLQGPTLPTPPLSAANYSPNRRQNTSQPAPSSSPSVLFSPSETALSDDVTLSLPPPLPPSPQPFPTRRRHPTDSGSKIDSDLAYPQVATINLSSLEAVPVPPPHHPTPSAHNPSPTLISKKRSPDCPTGDRPIEASTPWHSVQAQSLFMPWTAPPQEQWADLPDWENEPAEPLTVWQEREHIQRLQQEQRGERWNE